MTDYFATQLTGTLCASRNCAAAAGAMGLAAAGGPRLTADQFRSQAGVSCVPGVHSQSGGLFISDVIRVFTKFAEDIDYGPVELGYTRWSPPMLAIKLGQGFGAVLLGDYDALPAKYRASATFLGDHSAWVHDYQAADQTLCWHDPLRTKRIRIPITAAIAYWQKAGSPIRGYAGFARIAVTPPDTLTEDEVLTTITVLPFGGTFTVPPNTEVEGFRINADGSITHGPTFGPRATASSAAYDATVTTTATRGGPFLRVTNGVLAGCLIAAAKVTETPNPVPDCASAVAVAREKDRTAVLAAIEAVYP